MSRFVLRICIGLLIMGMGVAFASAGLGAPDVQADADVQATAAPTPANLAILGILGIGAVILLARPRRRVVQATRSQD